MMKKVSVIMPIYHNPQMTIDAVESMYKYTKDVDWHLIAVIDGCDKELIDYFSRHKDIEVIYHKYSQGFINSCNAGLAKVGKDSDYILLLNNDVVIEDDLWLKKMVDTFDEATGAVGCISDWVMGIQKDIDIHKDLPKIHYATFLIGFCMLVRKDVFDIIGRLDTRFGMGGNDDLDLSIRMRLCGYDLKVNRNVFVHHIGSQSLPKATNVTDLEIKTRIWLNKKWGENLVNSLFNITNNFLITGVN